MEVFQKILPMLIFVGAMMAFGDFPKGIFVGIPLFVVSIHLYYPGSMWLQIILCILWILLALGNGKVTAYSVMPQKVPRPLLIFLVLFGVAAAVAAFLALYTGIDADTAGEWAKFVLMMLGIGVLSSVLFHNLVMYVFCPMLVLEKKEMQATIADYYKTYGRRNAGHYVHFENDKDIYSVGVLLFRKVRNKIGVPVTYVKCRCPLGVHFIRKIRIPTNGIGYGAAWETSPKRKEQRKILYIALLFCGVSIVFFLLVFGIAGILPWQK